MNSVVNDTVRRFTPFRRVYDAGDAGGVRAAGVEFIDENGGGPGVRLRKSGHPRASE
jgi:hypothetical protein